MGGGGQTLEVYAFKVESIHARVGLYKDLKEKLRDTGSHALLACLFQDNSPHFRLSLITRSLNEKGEIDYSHPKRQSFLLGKDIKTRSAQDQLSKLQGAQSLEDIEEAFSLEQLSREFFQAITKHFTHLYENIKFPKTLNEEASRAFSLRLLARVLFCKFLERKGLIPSGIWDTSLSEHYYHEVLEPLFFGTLNTPKSERNYGLLDSKITHLLDSIPYLNGGLFSPQENDFYEPKSPQAYINTLQVPTTILTELFKNLSEFHFTLDESTPIDQEVGLDPEMLGMVFENLLSMLFTDHKIDNLSSLRKQTGSYYTPREIVSYMAKSCILEYLKTHTTISDSSLRSLVFEYEHEFGYQEILSLLTALSGFRVLDPACGSGAFPMGILQELTQILEALDEEGTAFMALQSQEFKASHQDKDPRYIRKLHILQNNIYGVDIQPMATEISRLRCFLSLICDEDKNKIEPLPNLEFKFLTANSLLPLTQEKQLNYAGFTTDMKQIQAIRQDFLLASTQEKDKLKESYLKLRDKIAKETFATSIAEDNPLLNYNPFDSQSKAEFFDPVFMFGVEKFDCVIGNPPYISSPSQQSIPTLSLQRQKLIDSKIYKSLYGRWDLYIPFIELGISRLCAPKGICAMIVPYPLTNQNYGKKLREMLTSEFNLYELTDLMGHKVFESAVVTNCIVFADNQPPKNQVVISTMDKERKINPTFTKSYAELIQSEKTQVWNTTQEKRDSSRHADLNVLGDFCYVSKGMALHADEKTAKGEFVKADLISKTKSKIHCREYIEAKDFEKYRIKQVRYLEYGTERCPNKVSRPTFAELYEHPKLLCNRLGNLQCTYNDNRILHNDSIIAAVLWKDLQGVKNRSISDSIKKHSRLTREQMEQLSQSMHLFLILGILNSRYANTLLARIRGNGNSIYPEYIRNIPIPKIDSANQSIADSIIALVDEILALKKQDSATDTTELESQINALVYTLYNLTPEEIELIERG